MKKNSGFTLAEVLITLAIIGVVAAMTVPALMTSTRGKEYEVGANKALSTIANAITMRIAMEGVAPVNFVGVNGQSIGMYLANAPGGRVGEQAALPVIFPVPAVAGAGAMAAGTTSMTLKDGMIVGNMNLTTCGDFVNGCMINVDTNGTKGPTRTQPGGIPACGDGAGPCGNRSNATPAQNATPDVIQLLIRDTVVEAANQRTQNILNTGNASIAQ